MLKYTQKTDYELFEIVQKERERQENSIEMVASESTIPIEELELSGSIFTNKTLEGYPGNRYQAGGKYADEMEKLGVERCKSVFNAEHANIQPISGSTANYSVYASILKPGDTVLAMSLDQGGHLTHGSSVNVMSKLYNFIHYGLNEKTSQIDYEELESLAIKFKPKLIISGGSSYSRLIDYKKIYEIARKVGAYTMTDMAHISGLVASKVIPSPVPYSDFVTSSTTKTMAGPRGGMVLCKKEFADKIDRGVFPKTMGSIHLNIMAAKTFAFKHIATQGFKSIMQQVVKNSNHLSEELKKHGFKIVSDGTDNHIIMVDLRPKNVTGDKMQETLDDIGITVNKNMIPFDTEKPSVTSGIRIGLTAVSQRGLKEKEIEIIANIINDVSNNLNNKQELENCKKKVQCLIKDFPLYQRNL